MSDLPMLFQFFWDMLPYLLLALLWLVWDSHKRINALEAKLDD